MLVVLEKRLEKIQEKKNSFFLSFTDLLGSYNSARKTLRMRVVRQEEKGDMREIPPLVTGLN